MLGLVLSIALVVFIVYLRWNAKASMAGKLSRLARSLRPAARFTLKSEVGLRDLAAVIGSAVRGNPRALSFCLKRADPRRSLQCWRAPTRNRARARPAD
jgi:hypothetical protein